MKSKLQTLRDLLYEREEKQTVFSEKEAPLSIEEKKAFAEALNTFSAMSETVMSRGKRLQEVVERVTKMCETASRLVNESGDDLVEKVAAGRHMKLIEGALKDFQRSANEVMIHERRMEAAYQDIAEGLKKYYDVQ